MNPAGQDPRLGRRAEPLRTQHRPHIDTRSQRVEQPTARFVLSGESNRDGRTAERRNVARRVAGSSRNDLRRVVVQDQHRCLARDARDVAVNELIDNQIAKHRDADVGKSIDEGQEPRRIDE